MYYKDALFLSLPEQGQIYEKEKGDLASAKRGQMAFIFISVGIYCFTLGKNPGIWLIISICHLSDQIVM